MSQGNNEKFRMFVDDYGIPYNCFGTYSDIPIGTQQSVLAIAERGLWCWNNFIVEKPCKPLLLSYDWQRWPLNKELNPMSREQAIAQLFACADWLCDNLIECDDLAIWQYSYPFIFDTKPGWRSAHAQVVGLQLLLRAYQLKNETRYMKFLQKLLFAFSVKVEAGGLCSYTDSGNFWFEKFADPKNTKGKVLNGHCFVVIGLQDIYQLTKLPEALSLAESGLAATLECLYQYDLGNWSAYDTTKRRASSRYHKIHLDQLEALSSTYSDPILTRYKIKWSENTSIK